MFSSLERHNTAFFTLQPIILYSKWLRYESSVPLVVQYEAYQVPVVFLKHTIEYRSLAKTMHLIEVLLLLSECLPFDLAKIIINLHIIDRKWR